MIFSVFVKHNCHCLQGKDGCNNCLFEINGRLLKTDVSAYVYVYVVVYVCIHNMIDYTSCVYKPLTRRLWVL
jgi:hypothetical protein